MKKTWFEGLQVLKAILFIMIFLGHSGKFIATYGLLGGAAVAPFFVISGFLSGHGYDESNDKEIWAIACFKSLWKKLIKFYPLYFITLLFALYLKDGLLEGFLRHVFLIQSYFGDAEATMAFNSVGWFLSSIMLSYLLAPLINRICCRIKRVAHIYLSLC